MSLCGPNLCPSARVEHVVELCPSARVEHAVEPAARSSERKDCLSAAGGGGDEHGPLTVPLPAKQFSGPGLAGLRSPGSCATTSTTCSPASGTSIFSLGVGERSQSQMLRGARKGTVIVNVVGKQMAPVKIRASRIAALEENGVLKWAKVAEIVSVLTGVQVTSLYYRVRCSANGSLTEEREKGETTMRLVLFEDGPNPFLGGMAVDAYLNGEIPLVAMHGRAAKSGGGCCAVQ